MDRLGGTRNDAKLPNLAKRLSTSSATMSLERFFTNSVELLRVAALSEECVDSRANTSTPCDAKNCLFSSITCASPIARRTAKSPPLAAEVSRIEPRDMPYFSASESTTASERT
eukprot:CAMPEP_0201105290 /NCGR_PEP_ID=MMETSP0812-20130820/44749_1 /ASSEMBLY_ACC=CAM_ASM_000668 /TAXON_ID=98059 /ORGANISM="Dinobryon sp., Strain UTEXLB2267" /LENGTH=113 /DNA_ID=CAMNT_0047364991 /DNA_START=251 /DNA_END=592 /DNA_ORIENTATION=-